MNRWIDALIFVLFGFLLAIVLTRTPEIEVNPYVVTDKYETKDKYYIETWIEVDPMDYIGLDIGDEYIPEFWESQKDME